MKIAGCVPLAGQGVVARYGDLAAVTDGHGSDPDPLLSALIEPGARIGIGHRSMEYLSQQGVSP
jgi:hypothetical protein